MTTIVTDAVSIVHLAISIVSSSTHSCFTAVICDCTPAAGTCGFYGKADSLHVQLVNSSLLGGIRDASAPLYKSAIHPPPPGVT